MREREKQYLWKESLFELKEDAGLGAPPSAYVRSATATTKYSVSIKRNKHMKKMMMMSGQHSRPTYITLVTSIHSKQVIKQNRNVSE